MQRFFLVLIALMYLQGGCDLTDQPKDEAQLETIEQSAVTPRHVCTGDNDMPAGACFRGIVLGTGSAYGWKFLEGTGFWWNDARITTYASPSAAATWNFKTQVAGEVWFSVWIPSTNATARIVTYGISCGSGQSLKNIDQLYYSAQWVTLGTVGYFPAGTNCYVRANKHLTTQEINNGGSSISKMAIDGMKMTTY